MRTIIAALLILPALAGQVAADSYCWSGSNEITGVPRQEIAADVLRSRCRPGETVVIPAIHATMAAYVCDFGRQIVPVAGTVLCVYSPRDFRR